MSEDKFITWTKEERWKNASSFKKLCAYVRTKPLTAALIAFRVLTSVGIGSSFLCGFILVLMHIWKTKSDDLLLRIVATDVTVLVFFLLMLIPPVVAEAIWYKRIVYESYQEVNV